MAQVPCTVCGKRPFGKPMTAYVSWFLNGDRHSFKHSLDRSCAAEFASSVKVLKPLRTADESQEWPDTCTVCGQDTSTDLEPVYLTVFEPQQPQLDLAIATCSVCQNNVSGELSRGGIKQVDRLGTSRNGSAGAPAPTAVALDWLGST